MVLTVTLVARRALHVEPGGVFLALWSGALASGLGYVLWYHALRGLSKIGAAIVQLAVPLLAAAGGVALLGEQVTLRLLLSSLLVLGGISLVLLTTRVGPIAPESASDHR
jgi:drug/metabolite transporter (DMT)-like permease